MPGTQAKRAYSKVDPTLMLARLAGIEPATPWFVVNKGKRFSIASCIILIR